MWEWTLTKLEQDVQEAKRKLGELDALRSDVDRLERTVREARAEADGLRRRLEACEEKLTELADALETKADAF